MRAPAAGALSFEDSPPVKAYHRQEFYEVYRIYRDRCRHAPRSPARAFGLIKTTYHQYYARWLSSSEFMSQAFDSLERVFRTFDPSKYRGKKPLAQHFVNFFMRNLREDLIRVLDEKAGRPPLKKT